MTPILSILTPAIWGRVEQSMTLARHLELQTVPGLCEHLILFDNKSRSVGAKRQALLDSARGQYIAFVDDDDWVEPGYFEKIALAAAGCPDVITFEQTAIINGVPGQIIFDAKHLADDPWVANGSARRAPWHVCAWRREIVADCVFPDISYGEDLAWSQQARLRMRTARHIPHMLHTYRHSAETTAAPPPMFHREH